MASIGYLLSAIVVIPLVTHGVTLLSRIQLWTQPLWLVLLILALRADPVARAAALMSSFLAQRPPGRWRRLLVEAFGAAATVAAALIAQIGEQVDFLRFMPPLTLTTACDGGAR